MKFGKTSISKGNMAVLLVVGVLILLPMVLKLFNLTPDSFIENIPVHSSLEAIGAAVLIILTMLIFTNFSKNPEELEYPYLGLAFFSMGFFDLIHSFTIHENSFVFSHLYSNFCGGFWYGFIVLPRKFRQSFRTKGMLMFIMFLWLSSAIAIMAFREYLPVTVADGHFTPIAKGLNLGATIGFFLGSAILLSRKWRSGKVEFIVLALVGFILGISRLSFYSSELWSFDWWVWHGIRFIAIIILLFSIVRAFNYSIKQQGLLLENQKSIIGQLATANDELSQFNFLAAHDLQEPLRKISNYAELLKKRNNEILDDRSQVYIRRIISGSTRMSGLIENISMLNQVSNSNNPFKRFKLSSVVDQVLAEMEERIIDSRARLDLDTNYMIYGDPDQVKLLLRELLDNALKFRKMDTPEVKIRVEGDDTYFIVSVRDNGIGFDEKYSDRIFKVFQRLHPKATYPGTGVGLALCKRIVDRHKGKIWVESLEGRGSTFFFSIPRDN